MDDKWELWCKMGPIFHHICSLWAGNLLTEKSMQLFYSSLQTQSDGGGLLRLCLSVSPIHDHKQRWKMACWNSTGSFVEKGSDTCVAADLLWLFSNHCIGFTDVSISCSVPQSSSHWKRPTFPDNVLSKSGTCFNFSYKWISISLYFHKTTTQLCVTHITDITNCNDSPIQL